MFFDVVVVDAEVETVVVNTYRPISRVLCLHAYATGWVGIVHSVKMIKILAICTAVDKLAQLGVVLKIRHSSKLDQTVSGGSCRLAAISAGITAITSASTGAVVTLHRRQPLSSILRQNRTYSF